jgi:hypothetical protein
MTAFTSIEYVIHMEDLDKQRTESEPVQRSSEP